MTHMNVHPILEHFGIAVGALTGVLAARGHRLDSFGVLVLALVAGLGGGSLRDVIASDTPVMWLRNPAFLYTAAITGLSAFFICRAWEPPGVLLLVADAVALAFFTIAGTHKALSLGFDNAPAIALGVITGVAGGILRDVLTSRVPMVFQPQIYLYATAAFIGALAYCLLVTLTSTTAMMWVAVALTLILRLSALRFRIALPIFQAKEGSPSSD